MMCCLALLVIACDAPREEKAAKPDHLKKLASMMTGSYHSARQAAEDTTYFDISLEMSRIWADSSDGFWIYVEQAVRANKEKPYRQRVYHLVQENDSTFRSELYSLARPSLWVGQYDQPEAFDTLTMTQLQPLEGCDVYLRMHDGAYAGSTFEQDCKNSWGAAAYATSEVKLNDSTMTSWDRGFDTTHVQVWGATAGPYVFDKIADRSL